MIDEMKKAAANLVGKVTKGHADTTGTDLRKALTTAREALGRALRTLIHNNIHTGSEHRNQLENSYEAARNALANGPTIADMERAVANLKIATDILANHSLQDGRELTIAKEAHAAATTALSQLKSPRHEEE